MQVNYINVDEAIMLLKEYKKKNGGKIKVCTVDFNNEIMGYKFCFPEEGCMIVQKANAKTILLNNEDFLPHIELYSVLQDKDRVKREGIMHDIFFNE